jgi:hypothetical protein
MAFGVTASPVPGTPRRSRARALPPGRPTSPRARPCRGRCRGRRAHVRVNGERLVMTAGRPRRDAAVRGNDATDIWYPRGGTYGSQPSRPFRTADLPRIRPFCDLVLYSVTFNKTSIMTSPVDATARSGMRCCPRRAPFLGVQPQHACGFNPAAVARSSMTGSSVLAGVTTMSGRPSSRSPTTVPTRRGLVGDPELVSASGRPAARPATRSSCSHGRRRRVRAWRCSGADPGRRVPAGAGRAAAPRARRRAHPAGAVPRITPRWPPRARRPGARRGPASPPGAARGMSLGGLPCVQCRRHPRHVGKVIDAYLPSTPAPSSRSVAAPAALRSTWPWTCDGGALYPWP